MLVPRLEHQADPRQSVFVEHSHLCAEIVAHRHHLAAKQGALLLHLLAELTADGIMTARGNTWWHKATVKNLLTRMGVAGAA